MKVKIGNYPDRLTARCFNNHMDKKYGFVNWPAESDWTFADKFYEKLDDVLQTLYMPINYFLDKREQKVDIRIDRWDTWSMDYTLSLIVTPMLKQLKETKHGAPKVDYGDVPTELWPNNPVLANIEYNRDGTTDEKFFERWDWVLDEMIWAFEQKCLDNWDDQYMEIVDGESTSPIDFLPKGKTMKYDWEGMKKHQKRIDNGLRLFGKYYSSLWD